jgi:succinate dehydrogenase/fumarate reductase flavoprotein subunit
MTQLEQWGCPWSRRPDGSVNVRRFGGMKIERTWFAADKTGFHMLHTLFQTSLQFRKSNASTNILFWIFWSMMGRLAVWSR